MPSGIANFRRPVHLHLRACLTDNLFTHSTGLNPMRIPTYGQDSPEPRASARAMPPDLQNPGSARAMQPDRPSPAPRAVIWTVVLAALVSNAFCMAGSHLWVFPDSIDYIRLAGGLADRFDLHQELFLIRPPGYPAMLAVIFLVFGSWSPAAILVLQHGMAIAAAGLTALIAWHLTRRKSVSLVAGLMCAGSLQVLAYANLVLTETPYMVTLLACVYFLVRYHREGNLKILVLASLMAGLSYLLRPVGLHLLFACSVAALFTVFRRRSSVGINKANHVTGRRSPGSIRRRLAVGLAAAVAPAVIVVAPFTITNSWINGGAESARCLDYVLYLRAVTFDGLHSTTNDALADIQRVVEQAKEAGRLPVHADYRDRGTVIQAYRTMRGASFVESSAVMGRAARDLMLEYPGPILLGTVKYAAWMLLSPDPVYRFQPGGAPGKGGKRDPSADIYGIATYESGPGSWEHVLRNYRRTLPLQTHPRKATPLWTAMARWFHRHVDRADSFFGLVDSPYEEFVVLCGLGGILSLFRRDRTAWILVALVVGSQIAISAFLSGPQPRYVAPIKPLMLLYFALGGVTVSRAMWTGAVRCLRSASRTGSNSEAAPDGAVQTAPAGS